MLLKGSKSNNKDPKLLSHSNFKSSAVLVSVGQAAPTPTGCKDTVVRERPGARRGRASTIPPASQGLRKPPDQARVRASARLGPRGPSRAGSAPTHIPRRRRPGLSPRCRSSPPRQAPQDAAQGREGPARGANSRDRRRPPSLSGLPRPLAAAAATRFCSSSSRLPAAHTTPTSGGREARHRRCLHPLRGHTVSSMPQTTLARKPSQPASDPPRRRPPVEAPRSRAGREMTHPRLRVRRPLAPRVPLGAASRQVATRVEIPGAAPGVSERGSRGGSGSLSTRARQGLGVRAGFGTPQMGVWGRPPWRRLGMSQPGREGQAVRKLAQEETDVPPHRLSLPVRAIPSLLSLPLSGYCRPALP
ncbi:uncharacterized protein LOC110347769 [Heterocephalus glaber]|uniref:Uncharacterized protein LOC110347769 n=1 Tax=Heterocephalus glaber TaxID=10181 RepID=A0AAX6SIK0_HETGA|nr:uncharacterized protein LOC110347769 [Heterocephalus glaber]